MHKQNMRKLLLGFMPKGDASKCDAWLDAVESDPVGMLGVAVAKMASIQGQQEGIIAGLLLGVIITEIHDREGYDEALAAFFKKRGPDHRGPCVCSGVRLATGERCQTCGGV